MGFAAIKAIATYLPPTVEKNDAFDDRFRRKIGIDERHIALEEESSGDLALAAAKRLLADYAVKSEDIDFVLLCTQHPDYMGPTTACELQARLGLKTGIGALDFDLGCSGYVYGLALAKGLVETGLAKNLLFLTSSIWSKYINKQDMRVRPIFGDGATATLIAAEDSEKPLLSSFVFGTDGTGYDLLITPVGGSRHRPQFTPEVFTTDEYGNTHSNYELHMDGTAIMHFMLEEVPKLVDEVLAKAGLNREDIDYYVFHQVNKFMLEYVQEKCGLHGLPFFNDVVSVGNTVCNTIPLALESIFMGGGGKLERVMLAGFGIGLSWAGCIADLSRVLTRK